MRVMEDAEKAFVFFRSNPWSSALIPYIQGGNRTRRAKSQNARARKKDDCFGSSVASVLFSSSYTSLIIVSKAGGSEWGTGKVRAGDEESC